MKTEQTESQVERQVRDQVYNQLWSQVGVTVRSQFESQVDLRVWRLVDVDIYRILRQVEDQVNEESGT
jgi:hypothetical protein